MTTSNKGSQVFFGATHCPDRFEVAGALVDLDITGRATKPVMFSSQNGNQSVVGPILLWESIPFQNDRLYLKLTVGDWANENQATVWLDVYKRRAVVHRIEDSKGMFALLMYTHGYSRRDWCPLNGREKTLTAMHAALTVCPLGRPPKNTLLSDWRAFLDLLDKETEGNTYERLVWGQQILELLNPRDTFWEGGWHDDFHRLGWDFRFRVLETLPIDEKAWGNLHIRNTLLHLYAYAEDVPRAYWLERFRVAILKKIAPVTDDDRRWLKDEVLCPSEVMELFDRQRKELF